MKCVPTNFSLAVQIIMVSLLVSTVCKPTPAVCVAAVDFYELCMRLVNVNYLEELLHYFDNPVEWNVLAERLFVLLLHPWKFPDSRPPAVNSEGKPTSRDFQSSFHLTLLMRLTAVQYSYMATQYSYTPTEGSSACETVGPTITHRTIQRHTCWM